uniref:EGF-like domain-containing protein n=1 Tax=Plectus sambesii TaxID=2011161 RepID=A0A914VRL6_9BILA
MTLVSLEGKLHDRPVALEVFEDELFIVGRPTGMVWRLAKFGRSNETVMEHIRVNRPNKLLAIQKSKRIAYVDSPCTSSTCEDFVCVPESGNSTSYRCLCPRGLHPFGSTCVPHENVNASTACGEAVCLNGGTCLNPFTNECQCPASTWKSAGSRQCEFNQCHNFCLNGGTCSVAVANSAPTCTCPKDYAGARCGQYKCTGRCGAHGDCFVSDEDGLAHCRCDLGWSGEQCDVQIDICAGYCFTGGRCSLTQNGAPFCECPSDYHGRRCENCVVQSKTELVCRNGGHCVDKQSCECPLGYAGANCERDLCRGYCNNGGICMRNETGGPKCKCPQGFSGLTCDEDWCLAVNRRCLNGGICMHDRPTGPYCYCPSKFKGDRCETARSCEEYCQNNGTCRGESNSKQWKCNCKHGYTGDRCETQPACQGKCQNGALCQSQPSDPNNPVCICPAGLSGPSCTTLVATNCDELDCRNGAPCIVRETEPRCACPFGWTGLLCTEPLCFGYCLHGGECLIREHRTLCSCLPLWTGDRCEFSKVGGISTEDINDDGTLGQIMTVIVPVTVLLVLAIVLLYVIFVRRPGAARQFKHERLSEPRPDLDEYQNPVFMHGEEDEAAVTEATNFTNPMYDSVYNDTVTTVAPSGGDTAEHRGLLPRSRLEIRSEDA